MLSNSQFIQHLIAILLVVIFSVQAAPTSRRSQGYAIHITSKDEFCSFMPPHPGNDVGATEQNGKPFCTDKNLASGSSVFPKGFIKSAHYLESYNYVQVTGKINPTKYSLKASDGGGQYDNKDILHTTCNEHSYFVNLIEPDAEVFCIRCCANKADCNLGISQKGCESIVPGDYS